MYAGYVFSCNSSSLDECLRARRFVCSSEPGVAKEIGADSVVFFFNEESDKLVGPFTAVGSVETPFERGTWVEAVDKQSVASNIRVRWEELHEMNDAGIKFPFLKAKGVCKLSNLETQNLLNELEKAPRFSEK
jgi:Development and cell death domain